MENKHLHVPGAALAWPPETHRTCSAEHHFGRSLPPADSCIAGTAWDVAIDSFQVNFGVLVTTGGRLDQSRVDRWSCAGSARGCGCGAFCAACSMCAAAVFRMIGTFSGGSDMNFQMFGGR